MNMPVNWRKEEMRSICEINPRRPAINREDSAATTFVPMSAIDATQGTIQSAEIKPFSEVKRGYTYFAEGDVLFAKITPCMENGKHAIAQNLIGSIGFGSTEFHVLRPKENILAEWIWFFVRQPKILQEATNYFTGAVGQQRVPESFLQSLTVPLPPLEEQRRIAARLTEQMAAVAQARQAAEKQLQAARGLPAAYLREVFEPFQFSLPESWHWEKLSDICELKRGPFGGSLRKDIFVNSGYKVYEQQHAIKDNYDIGNYYITKEKYKEMNVFSVKPGDLIVSCSGTMGKISIVPPHAQPGIINQALLKLSPNLNIISPSYLKIYLQSPNIQNKHFLISTGTAIHNVVPVSELKKIKVPVPPLPDQELLVNYVNQKCGLSDLAIQTFESQLAEINQLPAALLRQAFSGALS